jgi:subtilisin family serine protease
MKKLLLLLLIAPVLGYCQIKPYSGPINHIKYQRKTNLSANIVKIIKDTKSKPQTFSASEINNDDFKVRLYIKLNPPCELDTDIFLNTTPLSQNWYSTSIYSTKLHLIENFPCIDYADTGGIYSTHDESVKDLTSVSDVHQGLNLDKQYRGEGIIMGIIDEGFDYTHSNFLDDYGNLRITRVWERGNNSGTPPVINGTEWYGSEYIGENAILNKKSDDINGSHGTHVAGIASGINGVAPASEIVLVSSFSDIENQNLSGTYYDAILYLLNYADEVGKPLVINMSFGGGHVKGPTEHLIEINDLANFDGLVMITAAGNDGDVNKHSSYEFFENDTKFFITGNTSTEVWDNNPKFSQFAVNTEFISGKAPENFFQLYVGVYDFDNNEWDSTPLVFDVDDNILSEDYRIIETDFFGEDYFDIKVIKDSHPHGSGRNSIAVTLLATNNTHSGDKLVFSVNASNQEIHCFTRVITNSGEKSEFKTLSGFENGDSYFTVSNPATSSSIVSVGSYNITENNIGDISDFSSKGPTIDYLGKPDISAPGNKVNSSVNSFETIPNSNELKYEKNDYDLFPGTSMASPVVAGITALWLEKDPSLSTNDILEIISNNSIKDSFTETRDETPNIYWGYGKIDAYQPFSFLNIYNIENNEIYVFPNPTSSIINIKQNFTTAKIYDISGKELLKFTSKTIDLSELPSSIYLLRLYDKSNKVLGTSKVVKQ